tara:strand:+ start:174 stop:392 length:219 start_codon:yes stop_codon:yes gene_type:complete
MNKITKFSHDFIKKIVQKKEFDELLDLNGCDLIEIDNWIFDELRKREDTRFQYVGQFLNGKERIMRIWTEEK